MEMTGHDGSGKLLHPHSYRENLGHFLPPKKASSDRYGKNQLLYSVLSPRLGIPGDKVSPQQDRHAEISTSHCVTNLLDLPGVVYHQLRIWKTSARKRRRFRQQLIKDLMKSTKTTWNEILARKRQLRKYSEDGCQNPASKKTLFLRGSEREALSENKLQKRKKRKVEVMCVHRSIQAGGIGIQQSSLLK